jgi:plastocyanin
LLGQLPLVVAVALIFGAIAYAAATNMPVGTAPVGGAAGAAQSGGAGGDAPITAFSGEAAAQQIPVAADPTGALKWDRTTYEAQAGDVTFVVTNKSSSTHNFAVDGPNVTAQGPNFGSNTTNLYTLKGLKPGTYQIVCNFPGHKAAGMVATLLVK